VRLVIWLLVMFILGLGVTALGVLSTPGTDAKIWHMPTAYPADNYQTETAQLFADMVNECAADEMKIVVHAGGSLFKGDEIKRAVETGQVPIGERLLSVHSNDNQMFAVDSVPFVASSFEAAESLWQVSRPSLERVLGEDGLTLLYSVIWPPQGIYFVDAVTDTAEIQGMKFRSYNATTARIAQLAGMIPVQIEAAEMSQALATGVVRSFMASGSSGYDSKVWEHVNYYYDVKAWLPRNSVIVNSDALAGLSDHARQCISESALVAAKSGTERAVYLADWYIEQLRDNGMNVVLPEQGFADQLAEIGRTLAEEWAEQTGEEGRQILRTFNKLQESDR
jgi:TRAP-type C4-dicarboxylate transport system substrate-binding protein